MTDSSDAPPGQIPDGPRDINAQVDRLVDLGVPGLAGISPARLREYGSQLHGGPAGSVVAVNPELVPAAQLTPLVTREGKAGFVVVDMTDLADFAPTDDIAVPDLPLYLITDVTRGDDMLDWTPTEAHTEFIRRGRSPLTVSEGVSWLLQEPARLAPGRCFMCIGSRKRTASGRLDSRTPAVWISGGTGRDGRQNKGAPKVGWCWAGNHHTWLGFASTAARIGGAATDDDDETARR